MNKLAEEVSLFDAVEVLEEVEAQPRRWRTYEGAEPTPYPWLGQLPHHWRTVPLKRVFGIVNGATPKSSEAEYWDGDIPWCTPDDLGDLQGDTISQTKRQLTAAGYESCGTALVPAGSLIVSSRAPIGHLAIAGVAMCTNQGCKALVRRGDRSIDYLYYHLLALRSHLQSLGQGSTFIELSRVQLGTVRLAAPPLPEQRAIAAFLRRETAKIDALVEKKRRLIDLLKEKRTALIGHAVTKGLNPNAPMKPSGVVWLGEIPQPWEVKRLRFVCRRLPENGLFKTKDFYGRGTRLINVTDLYSDDFQINQGALDRVEIDDSERKYHIDEGDIFFVRSSLKLEGVARTALVGELEEPTAFECHVVRITPKEEIVNPKFLINYLNTPQAAARLISLANQVTMATIDQEEIKSLEILVPPRAEQDQICETLEADWLRTSSLIERVGEVINHLSTYRSALISAAVTGKIDVRDEASE